MVARLQPVDSHRVPLSQATGCVLAEAIVMDRPSPGADVSAMDGYAVRMQDVSPAAHLPVSAEGRIGQPPPSLQPGNAVRIVTGGSIPVDADTVIRREDTQESADHIVLPDPLPSRVQHGANIRFKGENAAAGDPVATPGTLITPAIAGALATVGCAQPLVFQPVRVSVLITGDEVLPVDASVSPYQLRDSNGPVLSAMLTQCPWLELIAHQRAADDRETLHDAAEHLLSNSDALLLTGGVSMGDRDYVPTVVEALGSHIVFHRVPQRPGKPALGAIGPDGQAILGLPGNPVSVLVTARRMAMAVLRHKAGMATPETPSHITIDNADDKQLDLWWHRPVRLTAPGRGELVSTRGSGDVIAVAASDGFVELPPHASGAGPWAWYPWRN